MPKKRLSDGRTATPQVSARCPECGDVLGERGMVQHLMAKHGLPLPQARLKAAEAIRVESDGTPVLTDLAAQALEIQTRLAGLPNLNLSSEASARIRAKWETELSALLRRIEGPVGS